MSATDGRVQRQKISILNEKNVILIGQKSLNFVTNWNKFQSVCFFTVIVYVRDNQWGYMAQAPKDPDMPLDMWNSLLTLLMQIFESEV